MQTNGIKPKPFLRWAGGKRWLLPKIEKLLHEHTIIRYFEPFLGGGSVYFNVNFQQAYISDVNSDLINTYIQVRDNLTKLINILFSFENTEECYYRIRENTDSQDDIYNAARFIYLNQTSYNGLYRVNKQGIYNVPYGFRKNYSIDIKNLQVAQTKLMNTKIFQSSFEKIGEFIRPGDTIFLDPPYTVSHNQNGFIKYNQKLFTLEDQKKLGALVDIIIDRNAYYILTNGAHDVIKEIFERKNSNMIVLERSSLLGGKNAKRSKIKEYLFTNLHVRKE